LESLFHDKAQEHQLFLLPQPLVSSELNELLQVYKDVILLIQENNVNTNYLFSELVERHPNIHLPRRLTDKLSELPVEDFNIPNKNKESYFYVDKDKERDEETT
ncbi:34118_t:CDS:2, partial [Gigaspora margarita]